MTYVVVDIGCLECGNPSRLVGIFADRGQALATGATPADDLGDWDWSGDRMRVMFEGEVSR